MKVIALGSQRGAGMALTLEMLRALCGSELRLCAVGSADCCRSDLCRRQAEFESVGYVLQVRELREDETSPAAFDASIVQIREPSLHALALYGAELGGRAHTVEGLEAFLSAHAFRTVHFHRRWNSEPRAHWLRYEDLLKAPRDTIGALLPVLSVIPGDNELARAIDVARAADDRLLDVPQAFETSPYFVSEAFEEYAGLIADAADYLGYPPWTGRRAPAGPITTLFRVRQAKAQGDWASVEALLDPFIASRSVDPEIRLILAEALLRSGHEMEGRRMIEAILQVRPDYADAYLVLAARNYELGLTSEGRLFLDHVMARNGGKERVRQFLKDAGIDAKLLGDSSAAAQFPLGRDSVIAGFSWILGREPESEHVIDVHRVLNDDYELRDALLHSEEFRGFFRRLAEGEYVEASGPAPGRDTVLAALFWILGRPPSSREEVDGLLQAPTQGELRLWLIQSEEFRSAFAAISL